MIFRASKDFVRIMHNMFKDQMFLFTGTEDVETLSLKLALRDHNFEGAL